MYAVVENGSAAGRIPATLATGGIGATWEWLSNLSGGKILATPVAGGIGAASEWLSTTPWSVAGAKSVEITVRMRVTTTADFLILLFGVFRFLRF